MLYSQHLSSSRAIGIGAFTALADNVSSIDWNPAGLTNLREWELSFTNFSSSQNQYNLAFQSASFGSPFAPRNAAAFRVSPGIELDFAIPSIFTLQDSVRSFNTTFDKKISYSEIFAGGYAYAFNQEVSTGLSVHALEEKITDTQYSADSSGNISSTLADYTGRMFTFDAGITWTAYPGLTVGAVIKNAVHLTESKFPDYLSPYDLSLPVGARAGVAWNEKQCYAIAFDVDDQQNVRIGGELNVNNRLQARYGLYIDNTSPAFVDAVGLGAGGTFGRLQFDLAYIKFTYQQNRTGNADQSLLGQVNVNNLEYNIFSGDQVSLTTSFRFGRIAETDLRIEYADLTQEIFPAARAMYALSPVGKVRVRNVSTETKNAKVSFIIDGYMDRPTETSPVSIPPGEVREVPFFAVLNDAIRSNPGLLIRDGEVQVASQGLPDAYDRYQMRILLHGKNDWNGDVHLLKFFVTPADSAILAYTRSSLSNHKSELDTVSGELANFLRAKIIFNEFASGLTYVNDPKTSEDNVQYPVETLRLRGGDCDDMTVTYSTLLSSIGVSVAYVDVVPPEHPADAHIYLLFDTGISPVHASLIGNNQKRYVIRKNDNGTETIWIPVETTTIRKGFDEAWNTGAREYFMDTEVNLGILKGWVKIVDLEIPQ